MKKVCLCILLTVLFLQAEQVLAQSIVQEYNTRTGMNRDPQEEEAPSAVTFYGKQAVTRGPISSMPSMTVPVNSDTAVAITFYGAVLQATVDPEGIPTTVGFELGTDTMYGYFLVPEPDTISGSGWVAVQFEVKGIAAGNTYHFRVKAENSLGVFYGPDHIFQTPPAPLSVFSFTPERIGNQVLTYQDISTTGTIVPFNNFDDDHSQPVDIGFDFGYSGVDFNQLVINTNGFIKLGNIHPADSVQYFDSPRGISGAAGLMNGILKSLHFADVYLISPFNHDLEPDTSSPEIRVLTDGLPGSRICTIQFKNFRDKMEPPDRQYNNIQFQIRLHETGIIDFVYGLWEPSANLSAWRAASVGMKGPGAAVDQVLSVTKSSNASWGLIVPRMGNYCNTCNAFNFGNPPRPLPEPGRTFTFYPRLHQDLSVKEVYTLGKLPVPYGLPHVISAYIKNCGLDTLTNVPVNLQVTGSNPFTATTSIPLMKPDSGYVVYFPGYTPSVNGFCNVTVSTQPDSYPVDDSKTFLQEITGNTYSYCDTNAYGYCVGWVYVPGPGSPSGRWLAKFHINGKQNVHAARIGIGSGDGQQVYAVLLNSYGTQIAQSPSITLSSSNIWNYHTFTFPSPPVIENSDFYIGIMQTPSSQSYFPMGYQAENPQRRDAFYSSSYSGPVTENYGGTARYAIEAIIDTSYCYPVYTASWNCPQGQNSLIYSFSTQDGVTNITDNVSVCQGNPGNYNYSPDQIVTAEQGTSFKFHASGHDNYDYQIYADWNHDGDFYDSGEMVYESDWSTYTLSMNGTINIPLTGVTGTTRLRFTGHQKYIPSDPCGTYAYGETRDYSMIILPATAMTYDTSVVIQCDTTQIVTKGMTDVAVIGIKIKTSGALSPLKVNSFNLSNTGCTNFNQDVTGVKIYYTGNDSVFSTSHLFGTSTDLNLPVTGSDTLKNRWNYFWVTFDISDTVTVGDRIDAACNNFTIADAGIIVPPMNDPPGSLLIDYCIPTELYNDCWFSILGFSTSGGVTNINNPDNGCPPSPACYTFFSDQEVAGEQGTIVHFQISQSEPSDYMVYQIFADRNQDADLDDEGENVITTISPTGSFTIPENATPGTTRMRVLAMYVMPYPKSIEAGKVPDMEALLMADNPVSTACPSVGTMGETEDYRITVFPGTAMTWNSGTTFQCDTLQNVGPGMIRVPVIGLKINVNGGLNPIHLTALTIDDAATTEFTDDVAMVHVYFSGTDSVFNSDWPGQLFSEASDLSNPLTGNIALHPGTNYLWITYDVDSTATIGHYIDAACMNYTLSAVGDKIPDVVSPSGKILINYCIPTFAGGCGDHGAINGFSTAGGVSNIENPASGCNASPVYYTYYPTQNLSVGAGNQFLFTLSAESNYILYADWNCDGDFNDPGEEFAQGTYGCNQCSILVPPDAMAGNSRLRVIGYWPGSGGDLPVQTIGSGCQYFNTYGEAEDYALTILPPSPMTVQYSRAFQYDSLPPVQKGSENNPVIGIKIMTTGSLDPVDVNGFTVSSTGCTNFLHDISQVKIYYSGADSVFSTNQLFGASQNLSGPITGNKDLLLGENYFWVVYNVRDTATIGHKLDAVCEEILTGDGVNIPLITSPAGHTQIDYCIPLFLVQDPDDCWNGSGIDDFNTTGGVVDISNNDSRCPQNWHNYSCFTQKHLDIVQGNTFQFSIQSTGSEMDYVMLIDWNHDDTLNTADEVVFSGYGVSVNGSASVPSTAFTGSTRLRIISSWEESMSPINTGECYYIRGGGETEDYTINIIAAVPANTVVQNLIIPNGSDTCFNATQTITVAGNGTSFTVQPNGSAVMVAGQKIRFLPSTKVYPSGYMRGYISQEGTYCQPVKETVMIAAEENEIHKTPESGIPSGDLNVRVYPNPVNDVLNVLFEEKYFGKQAEVSCFNAMGNLLQHTSLTIERKLTFSMAGNSPGIYFWRIVTERGQVCFRVIRQ